MIGKKSFIVFSTLILVLMLASLPFITACAAEAPEPQPTTQPPPTVKPPPKPTSETKPEPTTAPQPTEPLEIKFATYQSPTYCLTVGVIEPWAKMVEEETDGRAKVTVFSGGSLLGARDVFEGTVSGIADIGHGCMVHLPGRFPLSEVMTLPFLGLEPDGSHGSNVLWSLYEEFPEIQEEWSDVNLLGLCCSEPFHIHAQKNLVRAEQLRGIKIRSMATIASHFEKMGMVPVTMPGTEAYMALQKGIVNAMSGDSLQLFQYKIHEVTDYTLVLSQTPAIFYDVMNLSSYDKLPSDVKAAIDGLSGRWFAEFAGSVFDEWEEWARDQIELVKPDHNYIYWDEYEIAKLKKVTAPVVDEWLESVGAQGLPGQQVLDATYRFVDELR